MNLTPAERAELELLAAQLSDGPQVIIGKLYCSVFGAVAAEHPSIAIGPHPYAGRAALAAVRALLGMDRSFLNGPCPGCPTLAWAQGGVATCDDCGHDGGEYATGLRERALVGEPAAPPKEPR